MALPNNMSYTTVTGRFVRAVADTNDPDREPDASPAVGLSVVFTPSVDVVVNATATPPVTIAVDPIVCTTDASGYLLGPDGAPDVLLVASTDEDLKPNHWTWNAVITGAGIKRITSTFMTEPGGSIDLATVVQVPASPGSALTQWQAAVAQTEAARDATLQAIADFDPGSVVGAVSSVNSLTGAVVLSASDVGAAPASHTHTIDSVTGLQSALDGKQVAGSYAAASHSHAISAVTGLQAALDGKQAAGSYASATHTHAVSDTTGLQSALDGKAATSHTHVASDVTDFSTAVDGRITASTSIVKTTGAQTVAGVKTFTSAPVVPDASFAVAKVANLQTALDAKVAGSGITSIVAITQTAYNALGTYPSTTLYVITGA